MKRVRKVGIFLVAVMLFSCFTPSAYAKKHVSKKATHKITKKIQKKAEAKKQRRSYKKLKLNKLYKHKKNWNRRAKKSPTKKHIKSTTVKWRKSNSKWKDGLWTGSAYGRFPKEMKVGVEVRNGKPEYLYIHRWGDNLFIIGSEGTGTGIGKLGALPFVMGNTEHLNVMLDYLDLWINAIHDINIKGGAFIADDLGAKGQELYAERAEMWKKGTPWDWNKEQGEIRAHSKEFVQENMLLDENQKAKKVPIGKIKYKNDVVDTAYKPLYRNKRFNKIKARSKITVDALTGATIIGENEDVDNPADAMSSATYSAAAMTKALKNALDKAEAAQKKRPTKIAENASSFVLSEQDKAQTTLLPEQVKVKHNIKRDGKKISGTLTMTIDKNIKSTFLPTVRPDDFSVAGLNGDVYVKKALVSLNRKRLKLQVAGSLDVDPMGEEVFFNLKAGDRAVFTYNTEGLNLFKLSIKTGDNKISHPMTSLPEQPIEYGEGTKIRTIIETSKHVAREGEEYRLPISRIIGRFSLYDGSYKDEEDKQIFKDYLETIKKEGFITVNGTPYPLTIENEAEGNAVVVMPKEAFAKPTEANKGFAHVNVYAGKYLELADLKFIIMPKGSSKEVQQEKDIESSSTLAWKDDGSLEGSIKMQITGNGWFSKDALDRKDDFVNRYELISVKDLPEGIYFDNKNYSGVKLSEDGKTLELTFEGKAKKASAIGHSFSVRPEISKIMLEGNVAINGENLKGYSPARKTGFFEGHYIIQAPGQEKIAKNSIIIPKDGMESGITYRNGRNRECVAREDGDNIKIRIERNVKQNNPAADNVPANRAILGFFDQHHELNQDEVLAEVGDKRIKNITLSSQEDSFNRGNRTKTYISWYLTIPKSELPDGAFAVDKTLGIRLMKRGVYNSYISALGVEDDDENVVISYSDKVRLNVTTNSLEINKEPRTLIVKTLIPGTDDFMQWSKAEYENNLHVVVDQTGTGTFTDIPKTGSQYTIEPGLYDCKVQIKKDGHTYSSNVIKKGLEVTKQANTTPKFYLSEQTNGVKSKSNDPRGYFTWSKSNWDRTEERRKILNRLSEYYERGEGTGDWHKVLDDYVCYWEFKNTSNARIIEYGEVKDLNYKTSRDKLPDKFKDWKNGEYQLTFLFYKKDDPQDRGTRVAEKFTVTIKD